MQKVIKLIAVLLIILIGMTTGYVGMAKIRGQKVPAFFTKVPVVGSYLGTTENQTPLTPLEKENQNLKKQLTSKQLQIKTYQDRIKALELAMKSLQDENKRLKSQLQTENIEIDTGETDKYKELAKYFAAMKAKDAAKILEQTPIDNDTIIGVLQYMDKDAAAMILSLIDPERAAVITKQMLQ